MSATADNPLLASDVFEQAAAMHELGRTTEAQHLYEQALGLQPDFAEADYNLALIYYQQQNWARSVAHFSHALAQRPGWAVAWYNLALCLEATGEAHKAISAYRRALDLQPDYPEALYNLGCLLLSQGSYTSAEAAFRRTIALQSDHAAAHNNLGKCLQALKKTDAARSAFETAGALDPTLGQSWFNLGEIEQMQGRPELAVVHYRKALEQSPHMAAAYNNLGNAYQKLNQYSQAVDCYRRLVSRRPESAEGYYNLGSALRCTEAFEEAMTCLLHAIRLKPDYADAWNNLALACKNIGDMDRALTCFNRALALDPELAVAHWNRGFVYLLKKDYPHGWADFEWRFRIPQRKLVYPFHLNGVRWTGQTVPQATILVHDEQGLGDTIQFARYLPLVKARCARVILETRAELVTLLQRCAGVDNIIVRSTDGCPSAAYDFHVPLMSLPAIFQTGAATIPDRVPYLYAEPQKVDRWRLKFPAGGLKIGLVWSGRPQHTNDRNRSCRLADLVPLLRTPGVHFYGLQKGLEANQVENLPEDINVTNLGGELRDFSDTAAVLANLDLIITVDTAVAHLAGAMARPVWTMIPFIPDWRWAMSDETTPWYPSMRLFRQKRPKKWDHPVQRIRTKIGELNQDQPVHRAMYLHPRLARNDA
jgi:tetratricopeptide (TPR) repeat protein